MHLQIVMDASGDTRHQFERPHAELTHVAERHRLDSGGPFVLSRTATPRAPRRPWGVSTSRAAAPRLTRPRTTIAVTVAPVTPASAHSVPLARQNSRMRSGVERSAAMLFEASFIERP
jgi:hypothetical protein